MPSAQLVSLGQKLVWGGHSGGKPLVVCEYDSFRELRALQLVGTPALRCPRHTQYVHQATSVQAVVSGNLHNAVQSFQACPPPRIWRILGDNRYKKALWRLSVIGIPDAVGHGIVHRSA
jgi:hypothetical protein